MASLKRRVAIVGAGFSGIAAAKTFAEFGHDVVLYERGRTLGGIWAPDNHYPGLCAQSPGDIFHFGATGSTPAQYKRDQPTADEVYNYLCAYAEEYGVMKRIQLRTELVKAEPKYDSAFPAEAGGAPVGWRLTLRRTDSGKQEQAEVDVLLIATGPFSSPSKPPIKGAADFTAGGGVLVHSAELQALVADRTSGGGGGASVCSGTDLVKFVAGKRVVVVGNGKSGDDLTNMLGEGGTAQSVTQVCRRALWAMPLHVAGLLHLKYALGSRLGCAFLKPLHAFPPVLSWIHDVVSWFQWRMIENVIKWQQGLTKACSVPAEGPEKAMDTRTHVEPRNFFANLRRGLFTRRMSDLQALEPGAVVLSDGSRLEADVVILATGYRRNTLPFLPPDLYGKIVRPDGTLDLYHKAYPFEIGGSSLFVLGWNVGLFVPVAADITARWALEKVEGRIKVTQDQMRAYNEHLHEWGDRNFPPNVAADIRGGATPAYQFEHMDDMLRDMGASFKGLSWAEYLDLYVGPINAGLYHRVLRSIPVPAC
ncbi:hypothetical protein HYH03_002938 [Edaphochlamys debaryana]|uniref:FAD/NAD(P)-binding domain-containing protein n=1 Tax=Edaphochlamys debaryana TaxID=47281 RepID=A0A836C4W8_9CHLO|nr:hypothetical protein HYH03_002938 [Edaphochlamys debaryana]|eukprot:KAG2499363.1 hypothetical protein HYH03_002938 [Edaphochlamys debaryana]